MAITKVSRGLLSTGIVDNSNATAITIDSSENVGIGTSSPSYQLDVENSASASDSSTISVVSGTSGYAQLLLGDTESDARGYVVYQNSNDSLQIASGGSERMRIDSSGRFIVGNTSAFNSSSFCVDQSGLGQFRRDGTPLIIRRDGSDGGLIDFEKDGGSVGSIGTQGGDLNIGTAACGIAFVDGVPAVYPWTTSGNATRDAAIDLGDSSGRFKDLYLSGGAYLGGTAAANHLDDYEEGTWTPAYNNGGSIAYTTQYGSYVKIGRLVHLACNIDVDTVSGTNSGAMQISGAPFTNDGVDETGGSVGINLSGWLNGSGSDTIQINATNASILPAKDTINDIYRGTDIGTGFVRWSIVYMTDQ